MSVTALSNIKHDGILYSAGDTVEVDADQAAELIEAGVAEKATRASKAQEGEVVEKPLTKKQLLELAEAEGLTLEVTENNTVAEIKAAIAAAREANAQA